LRSESAWTGDDPMLRTVEHRTRVRVAPFVSLANEPDYLALGWMRERPPRPGVEKHFGVWLIEFIDTNGGGPGVRLRVSR
jgi:hypothetical protein